MRFRSVLLGFLIALSAVVLTGCGGSGGNGEESSPESTWGEMTWGSGQWKAAP